MTVNNEIGVQQPIEEIGNHGITFMFPTRPNKEKPYFWNIPVSALDSSFKNLAFLNIFSLFSTGRICRSKGVFLHTDAAQAVGKIPINVLDWKVDLMSISGHKIYGPKGEP